MNIDLLAKKARHLELKADSLCHTLKQEANSTFITPIDREDIHALARNLDDIIDRIEDIFACLFVYKIQTTTGDFKIIATTINKATAAVYALISLLKHRDRKIKDIKRIIVDIHTLENEGDELTRQVISSLFTHEKDIVSLIKWKHIFEKMEEVLDTCEETADIVDEIVIKNF